MHDSTLARFIKEIGRGPKAARDLSRDDAQALFAAMLQGRVPDLQLGAILIALRFKGESLDELAGFAAAAEASYAHVKPMDGAAVPLIIPAYNGARQLPNLVPLLALLVARAGLPVLIHGVHEDAGRITTREVLGALGVTPATSPAHAREQLAADRISFLSIDKIAPKLATMLAVRRVLGVRNSAHTIVKMLNPVAGRAVRIVPVTHPDYLTRMRDYFTRYDSAALLLRGAEGEAVAHPRREAVLEWAFRGKSVRWSTTTPERPTHEELPQRDAESTARWVQSVLAGDIPVPHAIRHQVECCVRAADEATPETETRT